MDRADINTEEEIIDTKKENFHPDVRAKRQKNTWLKWSIYGIGLLVIAFSIILTIRLISRNSNIYEVDTSLIPVLQNGEWGYVNEKGTFIIKPQFSEADYFNDGRARVSDKDGNIGFIDKKGKYIIPSQYKSATIFSEGLAFVVNECEAPTCINKKGKTVFRLQNAEFAGCFIDGLAPFVTKDKNGKYKLGYVNKKGKIAIQPQFSTGFYFSEGLAPVMGQNKKWGFINKKGEYVVHPQFDEVLFFNEGLAVVRVGEKYGYIDKKGKYVINPQFDQAHFFSNGLATVKKGEKWGVIDKKGKFVIQPKFDEIEGFLFSNLSKIKSGDKQGFINKRGEQVVSSQYEDAHPFVNGIAMVRLNGKWGFINKQGKMVVKEQFTSIPMPIRNLGMIKSDYYDCTSFFNSFLKNFNSQQVDGLGKTATLGELNKYQYPLSFTQFSAYSYPNKELTPDIILQSIEFQFEDDTYSFSDSDWDFDRKYNDNLSIASVQYGFMVAERGSSIAASTAKRLSSLYGGKLNKINVTSAYIATISGGNFNFIIIEYGDSLQIIAYFEEELFEEDVDELLEEIKQGDLSDGLESVSEI